MGSSGEAGTTGRGPGNSARVRLAGVGVTREDGMPAGQQAGPGELRSAAHTAGRDHCAWGGDPQRVTPTSGLAASLGSSLETPHLRV